MAARVRKEVRQFFDTSDPEEQLSFEEKIDLALGKLPISIDVRKEVILIYYMIDQREESLTKGTLIYNPEDGSKIFNYPAPSELREFENRPVT